MDIRHLVIGPADHGVVRFGRRLAELSGDRMLTAAGPDLVTEALLAGPPAVVHLQYTDALYADHTTAAATAFVRLRQRISGPVTVTLHDLPDPGDEPGRYRRRAASYARVSQAVEAVVLSSDHELGLLHRLLAATGVDPLPLRLHVVPLPIEAPWIPAAADRPEKVPEVAVFGFIYPGKGHDDVIRAMAGLPPELSFTALGRPAEGHEPMRGALATLAAGSGRRTEITGFVADDRLIERMQRIAVPVVPARRISASGSINSWIAAGRRPLVAAGPYSQELTARYPGAIELYHPGDLPSALRAVLAEPERSWLAARPPQELTATAVAAAYRSCLTGVGELGRVA